MILPDGSGAILCPVGKEYSMVSDLEFAALHTTGVVLEVSAEAWSAWYANGRRINIKAHIVSAATETDRSIEGVLTQWQMGLSGGIYTALQENVDDDPYPSLYVREFADVESDVVGEGIINGGTNPYESIWQYRAEGTGADGIFSADFGTYAPVWSLFIHRDKFYFWIPAYTDEFTHAETFSLTPTTMLLVLQTSYPDGFSGSETYTHTITDTFYDV